MEQQPGVIGEIIAAINEKREEKEELQKKLQTTLSKLDNAKDKSCKIWKNLNELEETFSTRMEIELYEFSPEYYNLGIRLNTIKEELLILDEKNSAISSLIKCASPEDAFKLGFSAKGQSDAARTTYKAYVRAKDQLEEELQRTRILASLDFMESDGYKNHDILPNLHKNIEKLRKLFSDCAKEIEGLSQEASNITKWIDDRDSEIEMLQKRAASLL